MFKEIDPNDPTPSNPTPRPAKYRGDYRSAIARSKKALIAAGFPWSVTTGRYTPYNNQQKTSHGVRVTRIGCSSTVAIHVYDGNSISEPARERRRWIEALAIQTMCEAGLPVDHRGWIDCAEVRS